MFGMNILHYDVLCIDESGSAERIGKIDPEKLEFLQGAVREAMKGVIDPCKLLSEAKERLESDREEDIVSALELIDRCIDLPDCSLNLDNLGLTQPILNCLSKSTEARSLTYQILSKSMQNNLHVQTSFGNLGALEIIKRAIEFEDSEVMKSRGISAISSLIRHNFEMERAFILEDGLSQIEIWMRYDSLKVREKSMSLLRHLLNQGNIDSEYILKISKGSIIDTILNLLRKNSEDIKELQDIQYGEILAETILNIVKTCKSSMDEGCKKRILRHVVERANFLSRYMEACPLDDVSPENMMLIQCEKLLEANEQKS